MNDINGQAKCPKCGATDIALDQSTGIFTCNFCRHKFKEELAQKEDTEEDILELKGNNISERAGDIDTEEDSLVTIKCQGCGAEIVLDTREEMQARCHWCRSVLSLNGTVSNGAVPDMLLPFAVEKEEAEKEIKKFVSKRKFFANPIFKKEFATDNIMGVYFPYMIVDVNVSAHYKGKGEHQTREYTVTTGTGKYKQSKTKYDADVYEVERDFDLTIDDLTVESSADKLENSRNKTNNIINSIMPFDTENAIKFNASYMKGRTSEKRDMNIAQLQEVVEEEIRDISRFAANDSLEFYDRGVKWDVQHVDVKGSSWKSAYLPVWIYSYMEKKKGENLLHYVAVNARTKETMGSVPLNMPLLLILSAVMGVMGILISWIRGLLGDGYDTSNFLPLLFIVLGIIFFVVNYRRYRNIDARHHHETETKRTIHNLIKKDTYVKKNNGQTNSRMSGANNTKVGGSFTENNFVASKIETVMKDNIER